MQTVVQIVPQSPSSGDGVGDYALALGRALATQGYASHYLVADPAGRTSSSAPSSSMIRRSAPSVLLDLLESTSSVLVIAHYVGYGYARRGCPLWLIQGLARWRRAGGRRLITIFHEVYAFGPPWTSSFWLSPLQRLLARRLARLSDGIITSLYRYAETLRRLDARVVDLVLPVVSTVGEPKEVPVLAQRSPWLVVFGSPHHRRRIYLDLGMWVRNTCRQLNIEEIVDIGGDILGIPNAVGDCSVRRLGKLPASAVQEVLLNSVACFIGYPPEFLPKSTVFAAACAHGAIPVCGSTTRATLQEGIEEGRHYWVPRDRALSLADAQVIASTARSWYFEHSAMAQAAALQRLF